MIGEKHGHTRTDTDEHGWFGKLTTSRMDRGGQSGRDGRNHSRGRIRQAHHVRLCYILIPSGGFLRHFDVAQCRQAQDKCAAALLFRRDRQGVRKSQRLKIKNQKQLRLVSYNQEYLTKSSGFRVKPGMTKHGQHRQTEFDGGTRFKVKS